MMELAVTFGLECAHKAPLTGRLHGHSYKVTLWFRADPRADIDCLASSIKTIGALVDHTMLEESVGGPRMEDVARWLMERLKLLQGIEPVEIIVSRPSLGYKCRLKA
jgi:6-pyruvoyl-tetrahydropterin synthase